MKTDLRIILLAGPQTIKSIATQLGVTVGATKALLKEDQTTILCKKNNVGQNEFWLDPQAVEKLDSDFEASQEELDAQIGRQEIQEARASTNPSAKTPKANGSNDGANTCPLCQAEAEQVQAGPEGSYLGACRTCAACRKTYNVFSKGEIKMAKDKTDTKRAAPLNPQYKINAKIDMAEKAGGKLVYQRDGRTWLLTKKGVDPKQMTAVEFSNETPETIAKYLGFTPPAPAPKAEKPAKAPKAAKSSKASKPAKTSKATGSGAAAPAKAAEKSDAELV